MGKTMKAKVLFVAWAMSAAGCSREPEPLRHFDGAPVDAPFVISDPDKIIFECHRSFHDNRTVRLTKMADYVSVSWSISGPDGQRGRDGGFKRISFEEFRLIASQLTRVDLFERSKVEPEPSTDGSTWTFSCVMGEFIASHVRRNAPDTDPELTALGLRLLRMADLEISGDELY